MGKIVGFTYDVKTETKRFAWLPDDYNAEFDSVELIDAITEALENYDHQVIKIGNVYQLLGRIDELSHVDIIFNISEGIFGRNRESQVPIILEMLNKPYVGSDGLTMAMTLDKFMAKKILAYEGINTPNFFEVKDVCSLNGVSVKYPLIVKPRYEGSSKGITKESVVENKETLVKQAQYVINKYRQPALVEEFIEGMEFTVAVLGNSSPEILPPVQIEIDESSYLGNRFYTFDYLRLENLKYVCPAKISKELESKLKDIALRVYRAVDCRDFGRIDFRVDKNMVPYVLEINPLPSLAQSDVFLPIANCLGVSWEAMINRILNYALERCGITDGESINIKKKKKVKNEV